MPTGALFSTGTLGLRVCSRYVLQARSPPEKVASTSTFSKTPSPITNESTGGRRGSAVWASSFVEKSTTKKNKFTLIVIMAESSFSHYKNRKLNLVAILRQLQMLPVVFCRLLHCIRFA